MQCGTAPAKGANRAAKAFHGQSRGPRGLLSRMNTCSAWFCFMRSSMRSSTGSAMQLLRKLSSCCVSHVTEDNDMENAVE